MPAVTDHCCEVLLEDSAVLAVADVNAAGTASWRLAERLVGGAQSGAWKLESADGTTGVLKVAPTQQWAKQVLSAERAVAIVRAAGYPTPAWLSSGGMQNGLGYQIQETVPGRAPEAIGVAEAQELIRVVELQAGLDPDPDRCWSDFLAEELTAGLADLRAGAAQAGAAGRELDSACGRLLDSVDSQFQFPRADMVHGDFRPANILFDHGAVSGVIDIEAIGSGTRVFDYATLLDHPAIDPDALGLLVGSAVEVAGPDVLRACFARVALDLVRFMYTASLPLTDQQRTDRVQQLSERVKTVEQLTRT